MNKLQVEMLRNEINNALAAIGEKYDLDLSLGNIKYGDLGFHGTLDCKMRDIGNGMSAKEAEYKINARKFGIDPETYGKTFEIKGLKYTIIGINTRARTMPIIASCEDGKEYKFRAEAVGLVRE